MMMLFAGDVTRALRAAGTSETDIAVDVGLTKEPYYTDKSIAIAQTLQYPSNPTHVHLVGFDTLIRFCNPKYYQSHSPPLSALAPFFSAGHRIRVTQRPYDPNDASSKEFGTAEEQTSYRKGLIEGGLEKDGFTKRWAEQIDMVPPEEGVGISSTRIRKAAKEGDWDLVGRLCTEDVAAWIKSESLYAEDDSGKKMMG
jgi:nicotinamide-nucleotide adenylyltransferase